jgi:desulfoferrodoxin (superoxide reductase-like protein)
MKNQMLKTLFLVALVLIIPVSAMANKTSVELTAPEKAEKGSEVTVVIHVKHMGNSATHFTDWVSVKINDKEVKRWEYNKKERPEAGNFTLEYKFVLNEKSKIVIQGNCNKHGSAGPKEVVIDVM